MFWGQDNGLFNIPYINAELGTFFKFTTLINRGVDLLDCLLQC